MLHIGRSKTGSTALQEFLQLNRLGLAESGILVPDFFIGRNHADLSIAYSRNPGRIARALAVEGKRDRQALRRRIRKKLQMNVRPGQTWIFTSEHLSARLRTRREVRRLLTGLTPFFSSITVVAQVRRADYLLPSLYSESVKGYGSARLDERFVDRQRKSLDHAAFVARWSDHHPADTSVEMVLLPYLERYRKQPERYFADWMDRIAEVTARPLPATRHIPRQPANVSLSAPALEFLRERNEGELYPRDPLTTSSRRRLIAALAHVSGPPPTLTPRALERLEERGWLTGGLEPEALLPPVPWQEWWDQPSAPVADMPELTGEERGLIAGICSDRGAVLDRRPMADRLPPAMRRRLRRIAVRARRW